MVAHLYHCNKPLAALRPDLSAHAIQWVEWLISRVPASRPGSVAEALQAFLDGKSRKAVLPMPVAVAQENGAASAAT
jgi:hypothetical protein